MKKRELVIFKEYVVKLDKYYASIDRLKTPNYENYSFEEIYKCILLFDLKNILAQSDIHHRFMFCDIFCRITKVFFGR